MNLYQTLDDQFRDLAALAIIETVRSTTRDNVYRLTIFPAWLGDEDVNAYL